VAGSAAGEHVVMNMRSRRFSEAAQRFAERRRREDEAPRLLVEVPDLASLELEVQERASETAGAAKYLRKIVVASAPAHFEIPCLDPACVAGGHDVTSSIMRSLRARASIFEGDDACHGSVRTAFCGRVLRFVAVATYRS
jgi:hypothetical protein